MNYMGSRGVTKGAGDAWTRSKTNLRPSTAILKQLTPTNLYNHRPEWLRLAHDKLDRAVLDACDWPRDISGDEIMAWLLEENLKREALDVRRRSREADCPGHNGLPDGLEPVR